MSKLLRLRTQDSLMNEIFSRVITEKPFDKNLKPYSEKFLNKTLKYFEEKEEFEKCQLLSDFISRRFNHELNYIKKGV
jgi:hypothetical protein